ncbi:MAG: rhamnan synthesis F family protein [Nitrosomonas sp.]|uniref:rhamnan synthesis F family protein n=1 Tax=Nitrosomonas sp. TaxID=42353 RepID=UPI0025E4CF39|nr:rhamnan synthesis F family protein [Nitrosomonas sp.]MBY0474164.1 rhamnan synthesis F family protein [Nitrosomonas sp.]
MDEEQNNKLLLIDAIGNASLEDEERGALAPGQWRLVLSQNNTQLPLLYPDQSWNAVIWRLGDNAINIKLMQEEAYRLIGPGGRVILIGKLNARKKNSAINIAESLAGNVEVVELDDGRSIIVFNKQSLAESGFSTTAISNATLNDSNCVRSIIDPNDTKGYYGCIDLISEEGIYGWLLNGENPTASIAISIFLNGELIGNTYTATLREDISNVLEYPINCGLHFKWAEATFPLWIEEYDLQNEVNFTFSVIGSEFYLSYQKAMPTFEKLLKWRAMTQSTRTDDKLIGNVDNINGKKIEGWAIRLDRQDIAASVQLFIDGLLIEETRASKYRADLREANIRSGFAAFEFNIPNEFFDGTDHKFNVIETSSNTCLPGVSEFAFYDPAISTTRMQYFYESVLISINITPSGIEELKTKKKVAIICSYFESSFFSSSHKYLFQNLRDCGYWILSVHSLSSQFSKFEKPDEVDGIIFKRNSGYDFGSWLCGIYYLRDHLPELNQLVLINDSIFGPLYNLKPIFEKMDSEYSDFWGLIDSFQSGYHLQSFFLVFNNKVLSSSFFNEFGNSFSYSDNKEIVIQEGELSLTNKLVQEGFIPNVVFKYEDVGRHWLTKWKTLTNKHTSRSKKISNSEITELFEQYIQMVFDGIPMNPTHLFWDSLIELGFPFIKRELLFKNPMNLQNLSSAKNIIRNCKSYPIEHIDNASRFFPIERIYL